MNILMITPFFPPHQGGLEESVKGLSLFLSKIKNKIIVLTLKTDKYSKNIEKINQNLIVYRIPGLIFENIPFELDFSLPFIIKIIKYHKIDIINAHMIYWPMTFMAILSKLFLKKPIIITSRLGELKSNNKKTEILGNLFFRTIGRISIKFSDGIIALTKRVKKFVSKHNVDSNKIKIIPNGVDLKKFCKLNISKEEYLKKLKIIPKKVIITAITRLHPTKGVSTLLYSFSDALKENPNIFLLIVGKGPELNNLINLTKDLNIEESVKFLGYRKDIPEIINISDIFIRNSLAEGLPRVFLETFACGKPIIATDVGGNRDIIKEGFNGFLCPPEKRKELTNLILKLSSDKDLREKLGNNGLKMIEKHFSWDKVAQETSNYFKKIQQSIGIENIK